VSDLGLQSIDYFGKMQYRELVLQKGSSEFCSSEFCSLLRRAQTVL